MPEARPEPVPSPTLANAAWPVLKVAVPPAWKEWLDEAAKARALSTAALVRQCIRGLMIQRHEGPPS